MEILQILDAGGNAAMVAIACAIWRLDRRVLSVELFLKHKLNMETEKC